MGVVGIVVAVVGIVFDAVVVFPVVVAVVGVVAPVAAAVVVCQFLIWPPSK